MKRMIFTFFLILNVSIVWADPPSNPVQSFDRAKVLARDFVYKDHRKTIYCNCDYEAAGKSGGVIDASECGYTARANLSRGKRVEWEHIVPAYYFGHSRACWKDGDPRCVKKGKPYRGRACCSKVDKFFSAVEADLHNLAPSVGELNGDRSNLPYGIINEDMHQYGKCEFKVTKTLVEPRKSIRGDVARVWIYMSETYSIPLSESDKEMFSAWSLGDPVDEWEVERDRRINTVQGNHNPHVVRDINPSQCSATSN